MNKSIFLSLVLLLTPVYMHASFWSSLFGWISLGSLAGSGVYGYCAYNSMQEEYDDNQLLHNQIINDITSSGDTLKNDVKEGLNNLGGAITKKAGDLKNALIAHDALRKSNQRRLNKVVKKQQADDLQFKLEQAQRDIRHKYNRLSDDVKRTQQQYPQATKYVKISAYLAGTSIVAAIASRLTR